MQRIAGKERGTWESGQSRSPICGLMSVLIVGLEFRVLLKVGGRKKEGMTLLRAVPLTPVLKQCCNDHHEIDAKGA